MMNCDAKSSTENLPSATHATCCFDARDICNRTQLAITRVVFGMLRVQELLLCVKGDDSAIRRSKQTTWGIVDSDDSRLPTIWSVTLRDANEGGGDWESTQFPFAIDRIHQALVTEGQLPDPTWDD